MSDLWNPRIQEDLPSPPLKMPRAIWQILHGRGFTSQDKIKSHYSPSLRDLKNPMVLDEMDIAVERLIAAFDQNEKVCIYADFDLDGTPGLALLKDGLERLGFQNLVFYQPRRLSDGYGVHKHAIDQFKQDGVDLIVTVDVGIADVESVGYAMEHGIDVIVTDHHLPKNELPPAIAIVNPNKGTCASEMGFLCGTGVAFYLVLALRTQFKELGILGKDFNPKDLLDLFAIGTITDMVPMKDENRLLVKHGLKVLANTERPGLKVLLQSLDLYGKEINASDVGFKIAPKLNALSRLEKNILPIDVLLVGGEDEAFELISDVFSCHRDRVNMQKEAEVEAVKFVQANPQTGHIWVSSENFHKGVVGLVATKMTQQFGIPAFVAARTSEGKIVGSARVPQEGVLNLLEALEFASQGLKKFGGHAPAAGFEVDADKEHLFAEGLEQFFREHDFDWSAAQEVVYDADVTVPELNETFMSWYESMGPFGREFESPLLRIPKVEVRDVKRLKDNHYKIKVAQPMLAQTMDVLWFGVADSEFYHPKKIQKGDLIDVLGEPQWNEFAGKKSLQILLKGLRWT